MLDLVSRTDSLPSVDLVTLQQEADDAVRFAEAAYAPATIRAYASDWKAFTRWCSARGLCPLPADPRSVAMFLAHDARAGRKASTVSRRTAAIRWAHCKAGHEPPTNSEASRQTLRGIRRTIGTAVDQKDAVTADMIRRIVSGIEGDTLRDVRDRALLLTGFAMAARRSELVTIRAEDIDFIDGKGARVLVRRSKTDQEGGGATLAIPFGRPASCPVRHLRAWLDASGLVEGPVFRRVRKGGFIMPPTFDPLLLCERGMSGASVAAVLVRRAEAVGIDTTNIGAHSLRAGFLTSAAEAGASPFQLQRQSRHRSLDVLAGYVRTAEAFEDHAGAGLL